MSEKQESLNVENERLRDALDHIARIGLGSRSMTVRTRWIVARAKSALNNDERWRLEKTPSGSHPLISR